MIKYKTAFFEVKSDIDEIFPSTAREYKSSGLIHYSLVTRTLEATLEEFNQIFNQEASERPGYDIEENTVFVPNIFAKISGRNTFNNSVLSFANNDLLDNCLVFNSISEFASTNTHRIDASITSTLINGDGLLDKAKVFRSSVYKYNYLKPEYQERVIDKINLVLIESKNIFTSRVNTYNISDMVSSLLNIDEKVMDLFNRFDYQSHVPKIIIKNEDMSNIKDYQAYQLALLNQLGFDIIIISEKGYADIENIMRNDCYSLFYTPSTREKVMLPGLNKAKSKGKIIAAITALAVTISFITGAAYLSLAKYRAEKVKSTNVISAPIVAAPVKGIAIESVAPAGPVKEGVETTFIVKVNYEVANYQEAILKISANDGKSGPYGFFTDNIPLDKASIEERYYTKNQVKLEKGKGSYAFEIKATPKKWDNKAFQVRASIHIPSQSRIISRDGVAIEISK